MQAEVDEFQNYESALNALREAQKVLSKTSETSQSSSRRRDLASMIDSLEKFIGILQSAASNPQAITELQGLIGSYTGLLKPGNVYSAIFKLQALHQLNSEALATLDVMKSTVPRFVEYVDRDTVTQLCLKCNISPDVYLRQPGYEGEEVQDEIREVIRRNR